MSIPSTIPKPSANPIQAAAIDLSLSETRSPIMEEQAKDMELNAGVSA